MLEKIQTLQNHRFIKHIRDIRVIGLLAFGVLVILVTYSSVGVIQDNYELEKQVAALKQQNEVAELRNTNIQLENQYYQTEQYLELSARKQFNKGSPGETLMLVPKSVALAKTSDIKIASTPTRQQVAAEKPFYQRNLESWTDFFLNRRPPTD